MAMHFVTDMTKGILGKPDPIDLWIQILKHIPESGLQYSPNKKFLFVAVGHGTEVKVMAHILLNLGWTLDQILNAFWIVDKYHAFTNLFKKLGFKNVFTGDFLKLAKSEFKNMKFDMVLGNPPYQKSKSVGGLGSRGKSNIWDLFVGASIDLLIDMGFLIMFHPAAWRSPDSINNEFSKNLWKMLTQTNSMIYLSMHDGTDIIKPKFDGVAIRFDCYLVQRKENKNQITIIDDQEGKIYKEQLRNWPWLPGFALDIIKKKISVTQSYPIIYNTSHHTQSKKWSTMKSELFPYPVVHTINLKGLGIKYFQTIDDKHLIPKVMLNQNECQYPVNDIDGIYGMSQLTFGIPITSKSEGDKIISYLNSNEGKRIIAATKWNTFYTNYKMFRNFESSWYK